MKFLNYPIEIWIAVAVAMVVRLKTSIGLGLVGALTTTLVGIGAGMVLHQPIANLFGLQGNDMQIIIAMVVALTAENLMKGIIEFSQQDGAAGRVITAILTRDPRHLSKKDD